MKSSRYSITQCVLHKEFALMRYQVHVLWTVLRIHFQFNKHSHTTCLPLAATTGQKMNKNSIINLMWRVKDEKKEEEMYRRTPFDSHVAVRVGRIWRRVETHSNIESIRFWIIYLISSNIHFIQHVVELRWPPLTTTCRALHSCIIEEPTKKRKKIESWNDVLNEWIDYDFHLAFGRVVCGKEYFFFGHRNRIHIHHSPDSWDKTAQSIQ